jgi:putative ATP-dependent endonuclease of the OLD family
VDRLINRATELHGEDLVDEHLKSVSRGAKDLAAIRAESKRNWISAKSRAILGEAARTRRAGWFKSVSWMESVARDIVGPDLDHADSDFAALIDGLFEWASDGG